MDRNVCKFISAENFYDNLNTVNFVFETVIPEKNRYVTRSYYAAYIVIKGSGKLKFMQKYYDISENDLFFTFPSLPYAIYPDDDGLEYIYISFLGIKGGKIMEKLKINQLDCVFKSQETLKKFWQNSFELTSPDNISMLSEAVILYTLSVISNEREVLKENSKVIESGLKIKKYIDDNFSSPDLSLDELCRVFKYNKKYLSSMLKKVLNTNFSDYIRELRHQHAMSLIGDGLTNIKDIAYMSGYRDSLYFSKIFKAKMDVSPREYIKNKENIT